MMSSRSNSFFKRLVLFSATFLLSFILGCADDVSQRVGAVKSDLTTLISLLDQPQTGEIKVMAKASSVSATVAYERDAALRVEQTIEKFAATLGYKKLMSPKNSSTQRIFCHEVEPARSVWVERLGGEPLSVSVTVSITGWENDKRTCTGKN
jgi:hypothetical protein